MKLRKIAAIIQQSRLQFVPYFLLAVVSSFLLAQNYDLENLLLTSLSLLFGVVYINGMNNTYDANYDKQSVIMKNENPIVTGELSLSEAKIMNFVSALLSVIIGYFVGYAWLVVVFIGIGLQMLYDFRPFRVKDSPFAIFFPPLGATLLFLFSYINSTVSLNIPPLVVMVGLFQFINGITLIRHIPDYESDKSMNVNTFTSRYGVNSTKIMELTISICTFISFILTIVLSSLSFLGLPIIIITTLLKISLLMKSEQMLSNPVTWKKFVLTIYLSLASMNISIFGSI